jgi:predicted PurR-regulated permease PerM
MTTSKNQTIFFLVLLGLVLLLNVFIFLPYLGSIFLAFTLAVIFKPVHTAISRVIKNSFWAAWVSSFLIALIILVPLVLFGLQIFKEAQNLYISISNNDSNVFSNALSSISSSSHNFGSALHIDINAYVRDGANLVARRLGNIFSSFITTLLNFFLVMFGMFFIWKDGARLKKAVLTFSPMDDAVDEEILSKVENAINSVIRGQMLTALSQGLMGVIGFTIFGVPNPVLWGAVTVLAALVPNIGTTLVVVPAVLYLYLTGQHLQALGMLIWGVAAIGLIDNFLGPILVTRRVKIHPYLIFLSVLGGIALFGPLGFLMGPICLVLLLSLLDIRYSLYKE